MERLIVSKRQRSCNDGGGQRKSEKRVKLVEYIRIYKEIQQQKINYSYYYKNKYISQLFIYIKGKK